METSKEVMTKENNKLIAEFMGGRLVFPSTCNYGVFEFSKKDKYALTYDVEPTTENGIAQHLLKFSIDWNWLMKVVEKCYEYGELDNSFREQIVESLSSVISISTTYDAVVKFIKWHNDNN